MTIPATANPRPDSLPFRVFANVTIPEMTLSGIRLTRPSRKVAIAHLLTGRSGSGRGVVIVVATVIRDSDRAPKIRRNRGPLSGCGALGDRRIEAVQHGFSHQSVSAEWSCHRDAFDCG